MREHNQMKKYLFGLLVLGCAVLSSCMKDDDEVVLSSECYIVYVLSEPSLAFV